jgi:hypothetical protein
MNVFRLIFKWKYHLIILVGAAIILSGLFSSKLFVKPLYNSYAVVYPSNIFPYSDESETEQMLQLFKSSEIRDSIIKKYDLGKHWGIDPNKKYYLSTLLYLYGQRIEIRKTEFESVEIDVMDYDPKTACDIVNSIISYYDKSVQRLHKVKFQEVVLNFEDVLARKRLTLDSIQTAIDEITIGKGLPPVAVPDAALIKTFADQVFEKDQKKGYPKNFSAAKRTKAYATGSTDSRVMMLSSLAMSEAEAYSKFKLNYDEAILNYNRDYTYSNIVVTPYVSDKKAFPKSWLIMSLSAITTFFLALVVISIIENRKLKPVSATKSDA